MTARRKRDYIYPMKNINLEMSEEDISGMFQDYVRPDPAEAVYTNRDLNLEDIKLVGFDMDYTLALYRKETMEELQFRMTIDQLVKTHRYPQEIQSLRYKPNLSIRGLVVDKKRGDLLKLDVHGRVWRAMHGHRLMKREQIEELYKNTKISISRNRFNSLDSLFSIPEAALYINLLDFFEGRLTRGDSIEPLTSPSQANQKNSIDHWQLFDDVRAAMDRIHFDGSLKSIILENIGTYVSDDPDIALTLHKLRSAGKRIFLLTNSEWFYTDAIMSFLLDKKIPEYDSWRAFFDIVNCEAKKPAFFTPQNQFRVVDRSGAEAPYLPKSAMSGGFQREEVYLGGNIRDFEQLANCRGDEILYVGDHIFGDIVRTKKESLWRTCLVVDELPDEIRHTIEWARDIDVISQLNSQRHALDGAIGSQRALLAHVEAAMVRKSEDVDDKGHRAKLKAAHRVLRHSIDHKKKELREIDNEYNSLQDELEQRFHPCWGRLFGEHRELSRFGNQVRSYACIYTGKLTNFLRYSTGHLFRATGQMMSHERFLQDTVPVRKSRLN